MVDGDCVRSVTGLFRRSVITLRRRVLESASKRAFNSGGCNSMFHNFRRHPAFFARFTTRVAKGQTHSLLVRESCRLTPRVQRWTRTTSQAKESLRPEQPAAQPLGGLCFSLCARQANPTAKQRPGCPVQFAVHISHRSTACQRSFRLLQCFSDVTTTWFGQSLANASALTRSQFADFRNSRIFLCSSAVRLARMRMWCIETSHSASL